MKLVNDGHGKIMPMVGLDFANAEKLTVSGTSQQTGVIDTFGVFISTTTAIWIAWGTDPTATSDDGSVLIPAGSLFPMPWKSTHKMAVIQDETGGSFCIIPIL